MGSRAIVVLCRDETISQRRFGVIEPSLGTVYTRTGRKFFNEPELEAEFLSHLQLAADRSGIWEELGTDWLCLDCELMPWSAKAQELLRQQYAPVGTAGVLALTAAQQMLAKAREGVAGLGGLAARTHNRLDSLECYVREYRQYCWPVSSLNDLKLAPFHLLASEGAVHTDKRHTWHMEMLARLCGADEQLLLPTPFQLVDLNDGASCEAAIRWWTDMTSAGREGIVVKPLDFLARGATWLDSTCDQVPRAGVPAHHLRTGVPAAGEPGAIARKKCGREAITGQP